MHGRSRRSSLALPPLESLATPLIRRRESTGPRVHTARRTHGPLIPLSNVEHPLRATQGRKRS